MDDCEGQLSSVLNVADTDALRNTECDANAGISITEKLVSDILHLFERYGMRRSDEEHANGAVHRPDKESSTHRTPTNANGLSELTLTDNQLRIIAQMCEDACACVTAGIETCRDCHSRTCRIHARALARANRYRAITRILGAHLPSFPAHFTDQLKRR